MRPRSQQPRPRRLPAWTDWAYDLARALVRRLPWLATEPLPRVAATLGARLGADWTATAVEEYLAKARVLGLLEDPDRPAAYLAAALDQALTAEDRTPPHPARAHTEHRRRLAQEAAEARHAAQARLRAELDARDAAGAAGRDGSGRVAFREARARLARRPAAAPARRALDDCDWPEPARPGSGIAHLRPDVHPGDTDPAGDPADR